VRNFKVKVATPRDVDILVHQRHMMFEDMRPRTEEEHRVGDAAFRKWVLRMMRKRLVRFYIVTNNRGDVAGGGGVWLREVQPSPGHDARLMPYLMSMFTESKFRRRGVATLVIREAERWASASGYPGMNLHASKAGRKVYAKLGWKRSWEMYTEFK